MRQPDTESTASRLEGLQAQLAAAQAIDRARLDHLAEVSHELKTPINGILGILGLLRRTTLDADQREMVDLMRASAEDQAKLVADLNRIARLDAGVEPRETCIFTLRSLLESVLGLLRPGAEAKGLELRLEVADAGIGQLVGDAQALRQITANLVGNAVKFTKAGMVQVEGHVIPATSGKASPRLRLVVSDTGPGVPADQRDRVFERFARGSTTVAGSGLGLHICKRMAETMDGTISLGETSGGGCAVTLDVPLAVASARSEAGS